MILISTLSLVFQDILLDYIGYTLILVPNMILSLILLWITCFQMVFYSTFIEIAVLINLIIIWSVLNLSFIINLIIGESDQVFLIILIIIVVLFSLVTIIYKVQSLY